MLKHLENFIESDPKLKKAPVNYEGVRLAHINYFSRRKRKIFNQDKNFIVQGLLIMIYCRYNHD